MGRVLEVISGRATNPAALTAATANTGDTFSVRDFPPESTALITQVWAQEATLGIVRIRSPRMHDAAQALRLRVPATARPLLPYGSRQRLYPTDPLTVEIQGGGAETDVVAFLAYYTDLGGGNARLATPEEVMPRIVDYVGLEQVLTTGATVGDYGASQSITADQDILKADTDYALLGYLTDVAVGVVGIRGPDTSNYRVGGPGPLFPEITAEWFVRLSTALGLPCIPVINSNNRGATLVDLVHTAATVAVNVTLLLAQLS